MNSIDELWKRGIRNARVPAAKNVLRALVNFVSSKE